MERERQSVKAKLRFLLQMLEKQEKKKILKEQEKEEIIKENA